MLRDDPPHPRPDRNVPLLLGTALGFAGVGSHIYGGFRPPRTPAAGAPADVVYVAPPPSAVARAFLMWCASQLYAAWSASWLGMLALSLAQLYLFLHTPAASRGVSPRRPRARRPLTPPRS